MQPETLIPFKLFGLQRSGTNLMQLLMLSNFQVRSMERSLEWKHGRVRDAHRRVDGIPLRLDSLCQKPIRLAGFLLSVF